MQSHDVRETVSQALSDGPISIVIALWLASLLYFNPRLLALLSAAPNLAAAIAIIVFVVCLDFFWLHTVYQGVMIYASWRLRRLDRQAGFPDPKVFVGNSPAIAILYTTRNDFREECAASCLSIHYANRHLFILDDSTLMEFREGIDRWAGDMGDKVTVIRRECRAGFKAGNLNHALREIHDRYPFFVVSDADGILPPDFIDALLPRITASDIAYVQARQEQTPAQASSFASDLGCTLGAHYRHNVRAREEHGFVMFYGHGALIRTKAWEKTGGFPEIATEDLAFSAQVRALGWKGLYADDVACFEDYPAEFSRLRIRTEKWIRGTSEVLVRCFPGFARSRHVPWHEKLDLLINASSHYQSTAMLLFLLSIGTLLPVFFSHFRYPGSFFLPPVPGNKSAFEYFTQIRYHIFWSWDFYFAMLATIMVPLLPAAIELRRSPLKLARHIVSSQYLFLSSMIVDARSVAAFLLTGRAEFRNTNDALAATKQQVLPFVEFTTGVLFLYLCVKTGNLWLFAPAMALVTCPFILKRGWESRFARVFVPIPCLLGILILAFVTMNMIQSKSGGISLVSAEVIAISRK